MQYVETCDHLLVSDLSASNKVTRQKIYQGLKGDATYLIVKEDSTLENFGEFARFHDTRRTQIAYLYWLASVRCQCRLHPSRLRCALEQGRQQVHVPVPRIPVRQERQGSFLNQSCVVILLLERSISWCTVVYSDSSTFGFLKPV
jgi:hypothetical protein